MVLTLNQTPSTDNKAIFLMRIAAEGNNIISDSSFDDGCGSSWTCGGDWTIASGVATYTYSTTAAEDLNQTVTAATGVEYILEYEVTAITIVDGFNFYLRGGASGTLFSSQDILLDKSLGKHSIVFLGDSGGGTTFRIGLTLMSAGETISIDNVKVRIKDDAILISTRDITLSGNVFSGSIASFNSISDLSQYADVVSGGGIGAITGYSFRITRHSTSSRVSDFFNDFFPAYDGGMIMAREVQLGVVWSDVGTPAYTDVTWLFKGRVIDYSADPRSINIIVIQASEIDSREIPYYSVQKDFDNKISYFPSAPEENYGAILPICYGQHDESNYLTTYDSLAPTILVDNAKGTFVVASHKTDTTLVAVHKYIASGNTYQQITNSNALATNNDIISQYALTNASGANSLGDMFVRMLALGANSDIDAINNVTDFDTTNYIELAPGETASFRHFWFSILPSF